MTFDKYKLSYQKFLQSLSQTYIVAIVAAEVLDDLAYICQMS
jgi:hypothetical protein